jgi:remodeling and spacing factor 1
LKYIDTSLVIETVENEAPVRQSRRIAQQKIKEETDRRLVEERMLEKLKTDAEKKKKGEPVDDDYEEKESSDDDDDSVKDSKKKRKEKSKIKASDKQWQTSSSHSENSEQSEDELEHIPSDPGSPFFKSDHEFSPESEDDDDAAVPQPLKRARTAKKTEVENADEEDINPNHACQVCHKTDSPEWILLCDECDCGYHW